MANTIKIDDKDYDFETLSAPAKSQIGLIKVIDAEVSRMQAGIAIHQTAREAYVRALKEELAKIDEPSKKSKK